MALTATVATAAAAVCAAMTVGVPPLLMALFLLPAIGLVAARPERPGLPAFADSRVLVLALGGAVAALYLSGVFATLDDVVGASWVLVVAVVPLSLMWPAPVILRFCLLLAAASLVGGAGPIGAVGWPLAGVLAGSAVALVSLHRASRPAATAVPGGGGGGRRQVARESAALFVVAGLVALLVASLLDPPAGAGGGRPRAGEAPGRPGELPPYLHPTDVLDAGGEGDGEGDQVVFRVTADVSSLWRTMTFDRYDGRTWRRSPELEPGPGRPDEGTIFVPPGIGDEERGELTLDHTVRIEASSVGVLPAAPVPFAVQLAQGRAYVAEDATVYPEPLLGRGATYRVTSILPYGADVAAADADERVPAEVRRFYLEHPAIPERVAALASELTAGATTRHARVVAVQEWLAANTEFRSGTPPLPAGADPVDRFLFEDGGGSSQQAASAMALLLRSAGVPARIGAGYLPGNRSPFGGEFVVRARHATTWVEVWFPSAGWVAFDPTLRYRGPEPVDDSLLSRLGRILRALWWAGALAVAGLGAWLAARLLRRRRQRLARPWATRCYERLRRAGARHGRPRRPEETPAEYCSALAAALPDERLDRVGELVTVGAYAGREPPPEERAWADEVVADVERRAPRRPPGGRRGAGPDGGPARGLAPPAPPVRAGRPGGGPG